MRIFIRGAALAILFAAVSCSPPRIDGGDAERTRTTIAAVRRSLPDERQPVFDRALKDVMFRAAPLPLLSDASVRAAIDGKTADEVIKAADDLRRQEETRRHDEQIRSEMAQLDGEFSSIEARDRAAAARGAVGRSSPTPTIPRINLSTSGPIIAVKPPITDTAAIVNAADPDVRDYCHQLAIGPGNETPTFEAQCARDEMASKKAVTGALPAGMTADVGQRVRENCAQKAPIGYRIRETCESADAALILSAGAHPEFLSQLPRQRQEELHRLMGH